MSEIYGPLVDGVVALALLALLAFGVPVEWIVGVYLALEVFSKFAKALTALLTPLNAAARAHLDTLRSR